MSALAKALDEIKFTIPMQVLQVAFQEENYNWRRMPVGMDEQIMNRVLRPRVLVDCNLVGGITVMVPLDGVSPSYMDNFSSVYEVPKDLTQGRSIVSVLSVSYMPYASAFNSAGVGYGNVSPTSMNEVTGAAQRVADSLSGIPPISNAQVSLIGENTVLLRDQFRVTSAYVLRCILSNDENMNNISTRSWHAFSELCKLAVKSFIYNTMLIRMDQAYLQGGQELGAFKSYVETLSDAEEMYQTCLKEKWQATAFMNDTYTYSRFLKMQVNPGV